MTPGQVRAEISSSLPVLIIDKQGSIAIGLYERLKEHLQVIVVGTKEPIGSKNLLFLSYAKVLPAIPHDPYSHIFFIPREVSELETLLPVLIKKAEEDSSRIFLILTRNMQLAMHSQLETFVSKVVSVIALGDIFANPLESEKNNRVEQLIRNAKVEQSLDLPEMGLRELRPIAFVDVIREILRIAFALPPSKKLFFVGTKEPITELTIAHSLQKNNPLLKIDFHSSTSQKKEYILSDAYFIISEEYPVLDLIGDYYKKYTPSEKDMESIFDKKEEVSLFSSHSSKKKSVVFNTKKFLILSGIFIIAIIFLPVILFILASGGSYLYLQSAVGNFEQGNMVSVQSSAKNSQQLLFIAQKAETMLMWEMGLINQQQRIAKFAEKIQMGNQIASAFTLGSQAIQSSEDMAKGKTKFSQESLAQVINNGKTAIVLTEKVAGETEFGPKETAAIKKITSIAPFFNVLDSIPNLIGMQGEKTYLILFQNNTELRPGGGFIGSYGLLTLNQGAVKSFAIHDVYDADGQLKGHIEPPFAIRKYIPLVHLYLRDSNFDVDFTKNAYMAALILQQETGQQVDGVIAVDLSFVKGLLLGLGSVYVPDYNETVTADNMFLLTENHAEKNFFPGSTQKKDFLRSLFSSLQNKITEGNHIGIALLGQLIQSIQEKHMLFAFSNTATQELFTANYLSSSLWDSRVIKDTSVNDFLGINEANLGVNKVNYWVNREVSQTVTIGDDGSMQSEVVLKLSNTSKGDWPGGDYKSYIRFILPEGAVLNKLRINGQEQAIVPAITDPLVYEATGFIPPVGLEVEKVEEGGKTLYGFLVLTQPLSTRTITINYSYAQKIDPTKPVFDYHLAFFKQPGTEVYPFSFSLSYPQAYRIVDSSPSIHKNDNTIDYSGIVSKDMFFSASFAKK